MNFIPLESELPNEGGVGKVPGVEPQVARGDKHAAERAAIVEELGRMAEEGTDMTDGEDVEDEIEMDDFSGVVVEDSGGRRKFVFGDAPTSEEATKSAVDPRLSVLQNFAPTEPEPSQ